MSPQIKVVAIVGLALTICFAGATMFLGRGAASAPPVKTIVPLSRRHAAPTAAPRATPETAVKAKAPAAKRAAVAHAKLDDAPKPKPLPNLYNLPLPLVRALAAHDTVVVALYSPESKVDTISYAEARAGAAGAEGDVGFVALSVLDPAQVRNLTEQLGVLSDPGILVYRSPGKLAVRIDGFADRETVAQAADDARLAG